MSQEFIRISQPRNQRRAISRSRSMSYLAEAIAFCRMKAYSVSTSEEDRFKWMRLMGQFLDTNGRYLRDSELEELLRRVEALEEVTKR